MNVTETFRGFSAQRLLPRGGERTDCTPSHCHSTSSVPKRYAQGRVAVPSTWNCTLRAEWQCHPHGTARSGPSGSAAHTATRRRAYGLHALTLPLDVERTETVRSGPNGRAAEAPVGGDRRPGTCSGVSSRRPGGLPTTRVPRAQGVRRETRGARARQTRVAEARGGPGGAAARGARGTCARQEPHRVWPGPARRPSRCERRAEIDEYVAQK